MARSLDRFVDANDSGARSASRRRLDRATARALASALAALASATVVVAESTSALRPEGTSAGNELEAGTITLVDDDEGRSLVDLPAMAPGRPLERCISVTYAGTVLPVDVSIAAQVSGDIADVVSLRVERGTAAGFGACTGFVSDAVLHEGSLAGLVRRGPTEVGTVRERGTSISFRFVFDLMDDPTAQGRSGSVDFVWEAAPA